MLKKEIEIPFVVYANDYHEFAEMINWLKFILNDMKIKIMEIEFDFNVNLYRAVIYKGKFPSKKTINTLCEDALIKFNKVTNDKRFGI